MSETNKTDFQNTFNRFKKLLRTEDSFDVLYKEFLIGGRESVYFFINGFVKDDLMQKLTASFVSIKKENMPSNAEEFSKEYLSHMEVEMEEAEDIIIKNVLSGVVVLFIEGYTKAYLIDCRS